MTLKELEEIKKNYKVIEIAVDFINPSYNISRAKRLDTARYIVCTLTENGVPRAVKSSEIARIRLQKPDKQPVYNDCDILEDGRVFITLTEQILAVEGNAVCDIQVTNGDTGIIYSTKNFVINIDKTAVDNSDIESSYEFNALNKMIISNEKLKEWFETINIDDSLSLTSENPVQNKVITKKFEDYYNKDEIDIKQGKFTVENIEYGTDLNDYQETGFYRFIPSDDTATVMQPFINAQRVPITIENDSFWDGSGIESQVKDVTGFQLRGENKGFYDDYYGKYNFTILDSVMYCIKVGDNYYCSIDITKDFIERARKYSISRNVNEYTTYLRRNYYDSGTTMTLHHLKLNTNLLNGGYRKLHESDSHNTGNNILRFTFGNNKNFENAYFNWEPISYSYSANIFSSNVSIVNLGQTFNIFYGEYNESTNEIEWSTLGDNGKFCFMTSGGEQTVANKPTFYPFFMEVGKSSDTYQIVYDNVGNTYTRYLDNGIWSDWEGKTIELETELKDINKKIEENKITVDSELSVTSENPVQNKVITEALNDIENIVYLTKDEYNTLITDGTVTTSSGKTYDYDDDTYYAFEGKSGEDVETIINDDVVSKESTFSSEKIQGMVFSATKAELIAEAITTYSGGFRLYSMGSLLIVENIPGLLVTGTATQTLFTYDEKYPKVSSDQTYDIGDGIRLTLTTNRELKFQTVSQEGSAFTFTVAPGIELFMSDSLSESGEIIERSAVMIDAVHNYSTEEHIVGTWIDDKPLYERTVYISSLPSEANKETYYSHNIENIDTICNFVGSAYFADGNTVILNHLTTNAEYDSTGNISITVDKTSIRIAPRADRSSMYAYVTIRYTKVNDSPITPQSTLENAINNTTFSSLLTQNKDLASAINEVFQSVSNGKTLVASAITDKGISTEATATFQTMANNINMISGGSSCGNSLTLRFIPSISVDKINFNAFFYADKGREYIIDINGNETRFTSDFDTRASGIKDIIYNVNNLVIGEENYITIKSNNNDIFFYNVVRSGEFDYGSDELNQILNAYSGKIYFYNPATGINTKIDDNLSDEDKKIINLLKNYYSSYYSAGNTDIMLVTWNKENYEVLLKASQNEILSGNLSFSLNKNVKGDEMHTIFITFSGTWGWSDMNFSNFKIKLDDTLYTVQEAVLNEKIKPLVLICSASSDNYYDKSGGLEWYKGNTFSGNYTRFQLSFILCQGVVFSGISFSNSYPVGSENDWLMIHNAPFILNYVQE